MTPDETVRKLVKTIRDSCPKASGCSDNELIGFASRIFNAWEMHKRAVNVAEDEDALEEMLKASRRINELLQQVSQATKMDINRSLPFGKEYRSTHKDAEWWRIAEEQSRQFTFQQTLVEALNWSSERKEASKRANYQAAVVAEVCRTIWMEMGPNGKATHELHATRDFGTPFWMFMESVFDVLNIGSSPSSALALLKKLGGGKAIRLSLFYG